MVHAIEFCQVCSLLNVNSWAVIVHLQRDTKIFRHNIVDGEKIVVIFVALSNFINNKTYLLINLFKKILIIILHKDKLSFLFLLQRSYIQEYTKGYNFD